MKKINSNSKENICCFLIIIIVFTITTVTVFTINNKLSKSEQKLYDIIEKSKNSFKNPQSLKVVSAKICNNDYSIIRITATNSYGAKTTENYYFNKNFLTTDSYVAKIVSEKCFNEELTNYDKVSVLSKESIDKVNKLFVEE